MPTKKITRRWLYNSFLVILIFLSLIIIAFSLATHSANGINLYESYLNMKKSGDPRPFIYPDAAGEWNSDKLEMQ